MQTLMCDKAAEVDGRSLVCPSFSFFNAVLQSGYEAGLQVNVSVDDLPVDSMHGEGMSTVAHSGRTSRDYSSERDLEAEYDAFYGTSPLSSPPSSPPTSPTPSSAPLVESTPSSAPLIETPRTAPGHDDPPIKPAISSKNRKSRRRNHEHRRAVREAQRAADSMPGRGATSIAATRLICLAPKISVEYSAANIPSASTGFIAIRDKGGRVYGLQELLADGFRLVKATRGQPPRAIVDRNNLVVAVVVGEPKDPGWEGAHCAAHDLLRCAADRLTTPNESPRYRRGEFTALNAGISFGGGQQVPGNLLQSKACALEVEKLLTSQAFLRLAGFASSAFAAWAPKLFKYYGDHLNLLLARHTHLRRNFRNSVWAAAAFNLGPRTVTAKHRDFGNLPFGWCSVTALGQFNFELGGHMVLHELKLILEFPPGFTIHLPSAAVSHSNTPIAPNESRTSFTQYTAGGLFRWVDHGFQTEAKFTKNFTASNYEALAAENLARTKFGLTMFSTIADLRRFTHSSA